ncbi:MAG TPA: helix-turn-helix transcriptional regulator, partial [Mycobacterium sp.]|nr:helix-turn-helix transcriptional regulator [Mycobacterium sp.]
ESAVALGPVVQGRAVQRVLEACYTPVGELGALRDHLLGSLRRAVPFDAAFVATADPDTLLFTSSFAEEPLVSAAPLLLDNEFGTSPDVNRFADLARAVAPVASLDQATAGDRTSSVRSRQIMEPLRMGDEARLALRVDGTTWGFMCLHRSGRRGFTAQELAVLAKVAPHVGGGVRRLVTTGCAPAASGSLEAVILAADDVVVAVGGAVDHAVWGPTVVGGPLPLPLLAVVRRLQAIERGAPDCPPATVRVRTRTGDLMGVHATRLYGEAGTASIVLTIAPVSPDELSSLLLAAYGLTPAQRRVAGLVLQGRTTSQIVVELRISAHTVQDHLKAVFDKTGARSRRALVNALMHRPVV